MIDNLSEFVLETGPSDSLVRCRITRNTKGIDRVLYPAYFLHMEREDGRSPVFLMAGRKRKKVSTSTYQISTDPTDLSKGGQSAIASLRSNVMGTAFILSRGEVRDRSCSPGNSLSSSEPCSSVSSGSRSPGSGHRGSELGEELGAVLYKPNVLGVTGPRKMKLVLPRNTEGNRGRESLLDKYRQRHMENLHVLCSKDAQWDQSLNSYVLNYHGRATQASVKNFQICHHSNPDFIIMQLGRVDNNIFHMDYRSPLSALQAFGIALSSFDCKLACE